MQHLARVASVAVLALGTAALSGCYGPNGQPLCPFAPNATSPPPAPGAAVATPNGTVPPAPVAAVAPTPVPLFGSTAPLAEAPSNAGTLGVIVAPYAPPPPQAEAPPPPTPSAKWIPGHWDWNGTKYVWFPGMYVENPPANANWVPGEWQPGPTGWTWIAGHWS